MQFESFGQVPEQYCLCSVWQCYSNKSNNKCVMITVKVETAALTTSKTNDTMDGKYKNIL